MGRLTCTPQHPFPAEAHRGLGTQRAASSGVRGPQTGGLQAADRNLRGSRRPGGQGLMSCGRVASPGWASPRPELDPLPCGLRGRQAGPGSQGLSHPFPSLLRGPQPPEMKEKVAPAPPRPEANPRGQSAASPRGHTSLRAGCSLGSAGLWSLRRRPCTSRVSRWGRRSRRRPGRGSSAGRSPVLRGAGWGPLGDAGGPSGGVSAGSWRGGPWGWLGSPAPRS